ncbi:MAG TPA: TonB-dependent siderophore receptor [Candidatus Sulfotelmatobacter sp.]|nr:TonB-dependent siderophore receptor [Candidatus Sulfotelmatobacter sp.]
MGSFQIHRHGLAAWASLAVWVFLAAPVRADEAEDVIEVPKISVTDGAIQGQQPLVSQTEGTKSYTSNASSVADKTATSTKDIANTVSVETRQYLDDRGITDIFQAMREMPGVTALPNNGVQSQYNARGYSIGGMYNGIPSYNSFTTFQQLDLAIYDRLEFLHGPAGLLDGAGQPGGVVNLVTKKAQKTAAASTSLSYGSWNNRRAEGDITAPLNEDGSLRARLVAVAQDRNFYYDNASQVKRLGYGEVEYDIDPSTTATLSLAVQTNRQSPFYGQPLSATGQRLNLPRSFNTMTAWSMDEDMIHEENASVEHRFANGWTGKIQGVWRQEQETNLNSEPKAGVNTSTMTTSYWGPEAYSERYYHYATDAYMSGPFDLLGRTHKLLLGLNTDSYNETYKEGSLADVSNVSIFSLPSTLTNPGNIAYDNGKKTDIFQYGPYGQVRLSVLDPLTLVGGGRVTYFDTRTRKVSPSTETSWTQGAKAGGQVTPYGGAIYDLTKEIALYGSWAEIFMPQSQQSYSSGPLQPRQGQQYEFGTKGSWFDNKLNVSLAYYDIDDINRSYADPDHNGYYLAMGEMETRGVDFEIGGRLAPGWDVSASYSYMISQLLVDKTGTGTTPTNWYPRHMIKAWAKYSFETGELKGLSLGLGLDAQSRIWGNSSNSYIAQSSYGVLNGLIGYEINDHLSLALNANNITDTKYFITTGRSLGVYNTYGDPQNFMLTLKVKM